MKERKRSRAEYIPIDRDFLYSIEVLDSIEQLYKRKEFGKALKVISKNINYIKIPSLVELSIFFDVVASILWKLGESNKAYQCWKKSYEIDNNNRHSKLSLDFLFNNEIREKYLCEMFVKLKMNEFIACNHFSSEEEKFKMIEFLSNYWEQNLANKDLTKFDDIELIEYFIGLKVF